MGTRSSFRSDDSGCRAGITGAGGAAAFAAGFVCFSAGAVSADLDDKLTSAFGVGSGDDGGVCSFDTRVAAAAEAAAAAGASGNATDKEW